MSSKDPKIEALIADCGHSQHPPHYVGYFKCFNAQQYYDAHDVLEALWLREGKSGYDYRYFKGLIQMAGAFVHLQWHHRAPEHRAHGRRLHPAYRLFQLALTNIGPYPDHYMGLDLRSVQQLCRDYSSALENDNFARNPWSPEIAPALVLS